MKIFDGARRLQIWGAVLAAIGIVDAAYLWYVKLTHGVILCGVGECETVNASPYASLLGIPVAALGLVGYAALCIGAVWAWRAQDHAPAWLTTVRFVMACGGLFFAAYLTGIEAFVLHAYCIWCLLQATAMLGIFLLLWLERKLVNA